jgi:diacylglycerol kinase (ATP)
MGTSMRANGGVSMNDHREQDSRPRTLTFTGRLRSFVCAGRGIRIMLESQHSAWLHAVATIIVSLLGWWLGLSLADWCWIVLAVVSVWTAEAMNTALELLTDVASPDFHPLAGRAKDVAAGAVLITAVGAAVIGVLVLGPRLAQRFGM